MNSLKKWNEYTENNLNNLYWNFHSDDIIISQLKNKKIILDIGCSTGELTKKIASSNPNSKIIGLDFSEYAIKIANKDKLPNTTFILENIENANKIIDANIIIDRGLLHCLNDTKKYFEFIRKNLETGGIIRIFHASDLRNNPKLNKIATEMNYKLRNDKEIIQLFNQNKFLLKYKKINFNKKIKESYILEFVKIDEEIQDNNIQALYIKYFTIKKINNKTTNIKNPKIGFAKEKIETYILFNNTINKLELKIK